MTTYYTIICRSVELQQITPTQRGYEPFLESVHGKNKKEALERFNYEWKTYREQQLGFKLKVLGATKATLAEVEGR